MNPLNYATLEASKCLVDAGIVLETEKKWYFYDKKWNEHPSNTGLKLVQTMPRPSMAEVWRELPKVIKYKDTFFALLLEPDNGDESTIACYAKGEITASWTKSTNPTDALIDLLIWVRKEKEE